MDNKSGNPLLALLAIGLFLAFIVFNASAQDKSVVSPDVSEINGMPTACEYLPIIYRSIETNTTTPTPTATPTSTATSTPTVTPTLTPTPTGSTPIITFFFCFQNMGLVSCNGTVKNVGSKSISDVTILITLNRQSQYYTDTGTNLIPPGQTGNFSLNRNFYPTLTEYSASVVSWIEH